MPQGKLAGCTVLQIDVTLNYTTHYLSWDMLLFSGASVTTSAISTTVTVIARYMVGGCRCTERHRKQQRKQCWVIYFLKVTCYSYLLHFFKSNLLQLLLHFKSNKLLYKLLIDTLLHHLNHSPNAKP